MIQHRMNGTGQSGRFWHAQDGHSKPEPKQKHEKTEDIAVCLQCTKPHCTGTRNCLRKMKIVGCVEDDEADR